MMNPSSVDSHGQRVLIAAVLFLMILSPAPVGAINFFAAGANFAPDLEVEVTGGPSTGSGTFDLKTGLRFSAGYEFRFNRFMSLEFESGFLYNEIDNEDIQGFEAWFGQVPVVFNAVFGYEFESGWRPFAGIGGGVTASILDLSFLTFEGEEATEVEENNVTLVPAWQVLAGVQYRWNDNLALAFVYKYLGTGSPEIEVGEERFEFDTVHNHFVGLQLNFAF